MVASGPLRPLLLLLALAPALLAHPHAAPTLWVDVDIADAEVVLLVTTRLDHLQPWLGDAAKAEDLLDPVADDVRAKALAAVEAVFAASNPVLVDGARLLPRAKGMEVPEDDQGIEMIEYKTFRLAYACTEPPQRVSVRWESFEGASYLGRVAVPGRVLYGMQADILELSPEEPEYVWHAKPRVRPAVAPPANGRPPPWARWLVAGCVGGLLVAGAAEAALGRRRRAVLGTCAAGVAAGAAALLLWPGVPRPSAGEARAIFTALHRNVYRAFEASTEGEVYDLLAANVEESILTRLYLDVHESLILRQRGGAVATIREVEPLGGDVRAGDEAGRFSVDWTWRVHCAVTHWGHTHRRVNEYRARFAVHHDGRSWRIAGMDVLDEKRVETDE